MSGGNVDSSIVIERLRISILCPGPKSHEISLKNLPILKIHNKDMNFIVDAILR
jgi:hypothetical protein